MTAAERSSSRAGAGAASLESAIAPAARGGRGFYSALSASSVGLEFGISVLLTLLFGRWLDGQLGTAPWLMLGCLLFGFAAGFRAVLRAVARSDRAAAREAAEP